MEEFFAYEHIKELVVHGAFGFMLGMMVLSYGYIIYSLASWIVKKVKKRRDRKKEKQQTDVCD